MAVFDIKAAQAEAEKEIAQEETNEAKGKIKAHLRKLAQARAVVANLEHEYEVLLRSLAG